MIMANPHSSKFKSLGHFAQAVRRAAEVTFDPDRRLIAAAAPSTVGQESVGTDGGYLVPPDIRADVTTALLAETSLLGRTDRQIVASNSITLPVDAGSPWSSTGLVPTIEPEGVLLGQSKLKLESRTVRLSKLQTVVPVTNELFEDAVSLSAYLRQAVAARLDFKVTDFLLNGDGVLKPLGTLSAPCKIMVTKEAAQAAGSVLFANVSKMFGRLHSPGKARAVWVIHPDLEPLLQQMVTPSATSAGNPVLTYPADAPYGFMFGRPVLVSEAAQVPGTEGDITLLDPMGLLTATREGIVREDFSIHVWFDLDLSAFRFTLRLGAVPWLSAPAARYRGASTVSTIVTLEAR
jgi:HK97 family phage major capsid protein